MSKRKERRERAREKYVDTTNISSQNQGPPLPSSATHPAAAQQPLSLSPMVNYYQRTYKKWLLIPIIILVLALAQIGYQTATTGNFLHKGVELTGGLKITLSDLPVYDADALHLQLVSEFPDKDIHIQRQQGTISILTIKADITDNAAIVRFKEKVSQFLTIPPEQIEQNIEITGASVGENFFKQTLIAIVVAFIFMGLVVIIYLRTLAPALAIILAAFSDMTVTLAVVNLLGIKLTTAGIVAFLFLIGYSVDTDMLLSARVLRRKEGTVMERVFDAMKTGLTMTFATIAAVTVALIFSPSEVIRQIMIVLLIGLLVDIINTWIQNVGILVWYLERKHEKV